MNLFSVNTKHTNPNILFVGGGRRISLGRRFIQYGCKLFSYELDTNSPISTISTVIQGLPWKDTTLKDHLNSVCEENEIDLVIPLQDEAVAICCDLKVECPASLKSSLICYDKLEFAHSMSKCEQYPIPLIYSPIILKPRFGFNSKGIRIEEYNKGLQEINSNHNLIWQKYIVGDEYSVDCYFNKNNQLIDYVPRKRVVVQGGEVVQSITINRNNTIYKDIGKFLTEWFLKTKPVGPYCIQFMVDKYNKLFVIEANARFGGGVILSLESGFDIIRLLLQEYIEGKTITPEDPKWCEDFSMTRYFSEHFYYGTDTTNI
jgi:carbamoyl-phosphate synthase large subunit